MYIFHVLTTRVAPNQTSVSIIEQRMGYRHPLVIGCTEVDGGWFQDLICSTIDHRWEERHFGSLTKAIALRHPLCSSELVTLWCYQSLPISTADCPHRLRICCTPTRYPSRTDVPFVQFSNQSQWMRAAKLLGLLRDTLGSAAYWSGVQQCEVLCHLTWSQCVHVIIKYSIFLGIVCLWDLLLWCSSSAKKCLCSVCELEGQSNNQTFRTLSRHSGSFWEKTHACLQTKYLSDTLKCQRGVRSSLG